jgi:hypothetical protein
MVISSGGWGRDHPTIGARAVWKDPARDQTLWRIDPPLRAARLVQRCLQAGGLTAEPAGEEPRGAAAIAVAEGGARVVVFNTRAAASAYTRQVARLVAGAAKSGETVVVPRANVLAIVPSGLSAGQRRSLLRCV